MAQNDWWDENGFGFLAGDQAGGGINYPGGSGTFDESAAGRGYEIPIGGPPENVPGAPPPLPAQSVSSGTGDYRSQVEQIMGGANEMTPDKMAALEAAGFHVTPPNQAGERSKIQLPTGEWVRIIGAGEGHPVWIPQGTDGSSASMSGQLGGARPGELQNYGVPSNPYASVAYGSGYTQPTWNNSFAAPQLNESTDPGLQARFNFGHQALERAAANKGTILNGGTQQALEMFGQDYASNEYANVFSRAFDQYKQKYGEFSDAANLGLRAEQNQYQEYLGENNRTLNDYLTNYQIGRTGVQDLLTQQNKTADRGLNATIAGRP